MILSNRANQKSQNPTSAKKTKGSASKKTSAKQGASDKTPEKDQAFDLVSLASTGYKKAVAQRFNASSISLTLRLGSRQASSFLGTGLASAMSTAGVMIGFAAAGLRFASGTEKLVEAVKTKKTKKALDGLKDYGAASVLGLTCAGMWAARKVALPAAAGFETFRGGYNFTAGYLTGDKKRQAQGMYDGVRAAGRTARALKKVAPFLKTAGLVLAPVAGFLQARKGFKNLALGLKKDNNRLELRGLVDIASAVGTTLLLTGVATVPGMVIFGSAQFLNTSYRMSGTVRKVLDPVIDSMEPSAHRAADGIRNVTAHGKELLSSFSNPFVWSPDIDLNPTLPQSTRTIEENDDALWYNECFLTPDETLDDLQGPEADNDLDDDDIEADESDMD